MKTFKNTRWEDVEDGFERPGVGRFDIEGYWEYVEADYVNKLEDRVRELESKVAELEDFIRVQGELVD
jgi:hypothetical protein